MAFDKLLVVNRKSFCIVELDSCFDVNHLKGILISHEAVVGGFCPLHSSTATLIFLLDSVVFTQATSIFLTPLPPTAKHWK